MKRRISFAGLYADHAELLKQVRSIARATQTDIKATEAVRIYLSCSAQGLIAHMRSEDEALLPGAARALGTDHPHIIRCAAEHIAIRERLYTLERALVEGEPLQPPVDALLEVLARHFRFEERDLFPTIEKLLSREQLTLMDVRLAARLRT